MYLFPNFIKCLDLLDFISLFLVDQELQKLFLNLLIYCNIMADLILCLLPSYWWSTDLLYDKITLTSSLSTEFQKCWMSLAPSFLSFRPVIYFFLPEFCLWHMQLRDVYVFFNLSTIRLNKIWPLFFIQIPFA